ncbi:MAG: VanZ family protein [Terracidiphilus sp.]
MSNSRRDLKFWISAWLPVAVGVAMIVLESTPAFGADHTTGPLRWLYQSLFGPISDTRWDEVHLFIRKSGHFLGYGSLGLLWLRAWWMTLPSAGFLLDAALALTGTALVASCDEWHQTYLPNRKGSPWDVLLDCGGAILMQWIVYIYARSFRPRILTRRD